MGIFLKVQQQQPSSRTFLGSNLIQKWIGLSKYKWLISCLLGGQRGFWSACNCHWLFLDEAQHQGGMLEFQMVLSNLWCFSDFGKGLENSVWLDMLAVSNDELELVLDRSVIGIWVAFEVILCQTTFRTALSAGNSSMLFKLHSELSNSGPSNCKTKSSFSSSISLRTSFRWSTDSGKQGSLTRRMLSGEMHTRSSILWGDKMHNNLRFSNIM